MQRILNTRQIIITAAVTSCLLLTTTVHAQFSRDYLKAADNYFSKADYASSAAYYEKYLKGGKSGQEEYDPYTAKTTKKEVVVSSKQQAVYQLAESYRLLTMYEKAAPLYQQITERNAPQYPLASYRYAVVLRALGKYGEAEKAINQFLSAYKENDTYSVTAQRELQNLRFIQEQLQKKDVDLYKVNKISEGKEGASYAPIWSDNNTLLFTATWPEGNTDKSHTNHLYQASYTGGSLGNIEKAALPATRMHEGAAAISADGNTLYLTRWTVIGGKKTALIYSSKKESPGSKDSKWTAPVALNTIINTNGANSQQPFIMPGGRQLLYVSDKAGGLGGYDLWIAELNAAGEPVSSVNLGSTVNTAFNEQAPYYHTPSGTLVFASDGRTGMGGYDLFYSKGIPGNWAQPENFGYPVNSVKDDMYFASHSSTGNILEEVVLSSDRTAVCCLELLRLQKQVPVAVVVPPVVDTVVTVAKPVEPPVKEEPGLSGVTVLNNVYYEFSKADVTRPSYPALDKVVEILNRYPNARVEIGGHTDDKGSTALNLKLSEERAANVVAYLVGKGIAQSRLTAKGYGASQPIAPNKNEDGTDNPEGREKNRRTEMKVLDNK